MTEHTSAGINRTSAMNLRLRRAERDALEIAARLSGERISEFARRAIADAARKVMRDAARERSGGINAA